VSSRIGRPPVRLGETLVPLTFMVSKGELDWITESASQQRLSRSQWGRRLLERLHVESEGGGNA